MFHFAFNVHLAELSSMFWVIIMHDYKPLTYKPPSRRSHVAAVCYDSQSDSICPSPGANPQFCNWQKYRTP